MEDTHQLIETVLKNDREDIAFEPIPEENDSPLAQPVVQKSNTSQDVNGSINDEKQNGLTGDNKEDQKTKEQPTDAPEQEIDAKHTEENKDDQEPGKKGEEFSMPLEHAGLMADSIIGTINNTVLEVGGGYFVSIRKHKDFYDFEEVIQVVDEQNVKNIKRIKLDDEDKALLRPLLIHILRKKAETLSPEKQLLMVALSIIIKKAKVVMEIRAENEMLVERIRDIIRKEVRGQQDKQEQEQNEQEEIFTEDGPGNKTQEFTDVDYKQTTHDPGDTSQTGLPGSVLETY